MKKKTKLLIGFISPSGSGKTYIAKILAGKLRAVHIRTDDIRVALRRIGESYSSAPMRAGRARDAALAAGKSVVMDFDAVLLKRRQELAAVAKRFGARLFFIRVKTPEHVILARLRRHRYTNGFFRSAREAIRTYYIRRALHRKQLLPRADFVINNARPSAPQIRRIVDRIKGL